MSHLSLNIKLKERKVNTLNRWANITPETFIPHAKIMFILESTFRHTIRTFSVQLNAATMDSAGYFFIKMLKSSS